MNESRDRNWLRTGRIAAGIAGAALAAVALPAAASAKDYCVNSSCGGISVGSFDQALNLADDATDADRIFLGGGTYSAPTASGYSYNASTSPLEIIGAGADKTIVTGPTGSSHVLSLYGGPGTSLHDVTIRVPAVVAANFYGLQTSAAVSHIAVDEYPVQNAYRTAVHLQSGGSLEDSTVTVGTDQLTWGVSVGSGGATVRRSTISAVNAFTTGFGGTVDRVRLIASGTGFDAFRGVATITNSLIRTTAGDGSIGLAAGDQPGTDTTVNADGLTIIGPALSDTRGVSVGTAIDPTRNVTVNLTNSIIRGVEAPLDSGTFGSGVGAIAASYSDYDPSGNQLFGPGAKITQANTSNAGDAQFVNAANGDYRLQPSSPLIDSGDPGTAQGADLDGNPLVTDGNGDGIARRDLGAFETATVPLQAGNNQATPPASVAPQLPDTQAPLIAGFKASPSVFAVGRVGTAIAARMPRGTRFAYKLSESAAVKITIQRRVRARRAGHVRYSTVGTLSRSAKAGANRTAFSGKIGKRALRAGHYRAVVSATDPAGNRSAKKTVRFRIVAG